MKYFFFIVALLLTISCGNGGLTLLPLANGATLAVGVAETYTTITAAVAAASNNDTITIENGTYNESVSTSLLGLTFTGESEVGVIWTSMVVATGSPSWSKTGGYNYIYEATRTDIAANPIDDGGIVDDNYTGQYELRASLAHVDALPGTFYESGATIYVHTSDDASPASHTMWYESDNAYQNILTVDGGTTVQNITFIGATQHGVSITDAIADIGTVTIDNCTFKATTGGVVGTVTGGTAGTLNITNSNFLYNLRPTYDPDYAVFTDALSTNHPYIGSSIGTANFATVNVEDNVIRYTRAATEDTESTNYNLRRNTVTDICVHPHYHNLAATSTLTIENSIFSMYGSTSGIRGAGSTAGSIIYVLNNTVYAGENSTIGGGEKRWFACCDSAPANAPSAVYIYNNIFLRDKDGDTNNAIPVNLNDIVLSAINMDYNYYSYGRVVGGENDNYVTFGSTNYTLAEWIAYTDGQADPKSVNGTFEATPSNLYLSVYDFQDSENANLGKILAGSPMIDAATATYAPATDIIGTTRPMGAGDDIGAYESLAAGYVPFLP